MIQDSLCTCRSGPCKLSITHHLTYDPLSQNLYNCALTSSRWNSPHSFLKICLLGFNPQVDLSKIFHFFIGRVLINFCQHLLIIQRFKTSSVLASPMAQQVKNLPAMQDTQEMRVDPWVGKIPWRRKWQSVPVFVSEKSHGQKILVGYIVHGVTESQT